MIDLVFGLSVLFLFPASLVAMAVSACRARSREGILLYWMLAITTALFVYGLTIWIGTIGRNDRFGFSVLLSMGLVILFLATLGITLFIIFFRRATDHASPLTRTLLAATIAIPLPLMITFIYAAFARWPGTAVAALGAGSVILAIFVAGKLSKGRPDSLGFTIARMYAFTVIIGAAVSLLSAATVLKAAQIAAGGRPYCIQGGNRDASNPLDLSIVTLRERPSPQGIYLRYHALLVIDKPEGREVLNWSWRRVAFYPATLVRHPTASVRPKIVCQPT